MGQTETLIKVLKEWNEEAGEDKVNSFEHCIGLTLCQLGDIYDPANIPESDCLNLIKLRIKYLMKNCGISEDFLVMGVVNFITELFEKSIREHGKNIIDIEKSIKEEPPKETTQNQLDELKDRSYRIQAIKELDIWKRITAKYFNEINRINWQIDRQKQYEEFEDQVLESKLKKVKEIIKEQSNE
ncbi:hypothetical protein [Sporohalobacter salinus]|uniref:hypothetical protein n=1 Tax=Sporohalobacter salinus TaxID=1494606 RepID=UPI00196097E9|nr:hypothetical protein [Sporohalobacter salinus]MBM7623645.1 hypothetical protein [Sporohalobacter salinus]